MQFDCDFKEFKHVASQCSTGFPLSPSILTLGVHVGSHQASRDYTYLWLLTSAHDANYLIRNFLGEFPGLFNSG